VLDSKIVSIGSRRARVQQLDSFQARKVARILMNEGSRFLKGLRGSELADLEASAMSAIASGLSELLGELNDETLNTLTAVFAAGTLVERHPGSNEYDALSVELQNALFGGGAGLAHWLAWLVDCLEFSCGDFFRALPGLKGRLLKEAAVPAAESGAEKKSPTESTGSTIASRRPISTAARR
jgi:hypothetical protein